MKRILTMTVAVAGLCAAARCGQAQEPAIWVAKGPHATVYLFGSVHVLEKDKPWRTAKIDAAIAQSGSLWLEIPDVDKPEAMEPLVMKLGIDAAHPLSTKLSKEQLARLDTVAKQAGIPAGEAALEPMQPWLAAISLSAVPMVRAGFDPKSGVENVLKPEFVKAGKPVKGFETAEQQFHYFADMPQKSQVDYLESELAEFDQATEKFRKLVAAWYAGDEAALDGMMTGEFRDKYPELYQTLIVKRNQEFAAGVEKLLQGNETVFVAVGAGHLVGENGVPALLRKSGVQVERE